MNSYIKKISFFLLLVSFSIFYAFQKPTQQAQSLPQELIQQKKQAEAYMTQGLWKEAEELYLDLQQQCKDQGLDTVAINFYSDLLSISIIREDWSFDDKLATIEAYRQQVQHPLFTGLYYDALAQVYIFYGKVDSMQKYYELAIQCFQEENAPLKEANLNGFIAVEFFFNDQILDAHFFLEKAEKILEEKLKPNGIDIPKLYNTQTAIYAELGQFSKALESNLISIKELEKDPELYTLSLVYEYTNLATLYSYSYDYNTALFYHQKALQLLGNGKNYSHNEFAGQLYNLGSTYINLGQDKKGKKIVLQAIQYLNKVSFKNNDILGHYINCYEQLFSYYYGDRNLDSAEYYLGKVALINKNFPYRKSNTEVNWGLLSKTKGDLKKARKYYEKAIDSNIKAYGNKRRELSDFYKLIGDLEELNNNWQKALFYAQKSLEVISLNFSDHYGISNPKLENILYKRKFINALERKLELMDTLYKKGNPIVSIEQIFSTAKLATEALEHLNKSIRDPLSKRYWLNQEAVPVFEKAIQVALSIYEKDQTPKYLNEAFMLAERSKSMLMMGALQEVTASSYGGVPDSLIRVAQRLEQKVAHADKDRLEAKLAEDIIATQLQDSLIFNCRYQLDNLKHTFETKYPKYYDLKYSNNVANIEQIQATLDDKTTFIEYFEGAEQLYAFCIRKDTVQVNIIPKGEQFKLRLLDFQTDLKHFDDSLVAPVEVYNRFVTQAHALYQDLLEPCLNEQSQRLIIIPDGHLSSFPFEVLLREKAAPLKADASTYPFNQLHYLIRDYAISYNYSGTLLLRQQASKDQIINGKILALAPSYQTGAATYRDERKSQLRDGLGSLPGAATEVDGLSQHFEGLFLKGVDANETSFKEHASEFGILHLAMHGLVNHKKPEFSCLAMTEDQQPNQDNFLHAYEIKQLALQAGLVVLSACETGSGKYQRGEGVLSIGRGFMYAGAPSLVMTLWQLNDQSGAVIIEQFYQNLSKGMEKDEALRQAKLTYLNLEHEGLSAHPFLWAACIQVGDYSSIAIAKKSTWMPYIIVFAGLLGGLLFLVWRSNSLKTSA